MTSRHMATYPVIFVKGAKACPICEEDTISDRLVHGGKNVYLCNRRLLHRSHPYRKKMKPFNGKQELRNPPKILSGKEVYEKVKNIENNFGKPYKRSDGTLYKKRFIFLDLPYWKHLSVRHCIDVMHVEKNVCESLIDTLLNIPGKTKDGVKARQDMAAQNIRPELAPQIRGSRTYLPPACYTLSRNEKISVCECLHGVKVTQGYSSNIRNLVSMKDLKLVGLKSHDCHTLIQQLLPVALRGVLPNHVRGAIIRLCYFFNAIFSKVVDSDTLNTLQRDVITTMCELEMFFPPSFFDIMQHLVVHLVREIKICGPVFLRNMYPFERYMKPLAAYVRNQNRPEGCMIQGYIAEEALQFVNEYMSNVEPIGLPTSRHEGRLQEQGTLGKKVVTANSETLDQAHLYILQHMVDVHPCLEKHQTLLSAQNPSKGERWLAMEHNRLFRKWFSNEVDNELVLEREKVSDEVRWLAHGPSFHVLTYQGYDVNGYSFYTKDQDDRSTMQNSGVALMAMSMSVASAKDTRPAYDAQPYFGVIKEIWELDYVQFRIPVFRCMWVEHNKGVRVDRMGFTLVDFSREEYKSEPFIMANQARQIFYIKDPADEKWSIVLHGKKQFVGKEAMDEVDDELPPFSSGLPPTATDDVDDFYLRDDHEERL
ncbi:uncharacterized protein LOC141629077 [Silene latifolia]|uniref:uncharacterized protein LOC141629077 n=1 Tax=Silene latifolia TaxID=37657 RepID=UPI003D787614